MTPVKEVSSLWFWIAQRFLLSIEYSEVAASDGSRAKLTFLT